MNSIDEVLAIERHLKHLAQMRPLAVDEPEHAARIDAEHRRYDERRMTSWARLSTVEELALDAYVANVHCHRRG